MGRQRGLSLTELALILLLVLALAAVVIPRLLNSRVTAGEGSAIVYMSLINQAQKQYAHKYPSIGFASRLSDLGGPMTDCVPAPTHACLLPQNVASANTHEANGYFVDVRPGPTPGTSYFAIAVPSKYKRTGVKSFCTTEAGTIVSGDAGAKQLADITPELCATFRPLP